MNKYHDSSKQKISDFFSSLCQYQMEKEYDSTISVFEGNGELAPICTHHTKGRVRLPLWKLLAVVAAGTVFVAILRGILSLFSLCSD